MHTCVLTMRTCVHTHSRTNSHKIYSHTHNTNNMVTSKYIRALIHSCSHHTDTHTHTHTRARAYTLTMCICMYTHTHSHTLAQNILTHAQYEHYSYISIHSCEHHTHKRARAHTLIHTHTHTRIHTCTHTKVYTSTNTHA